tara:strand:- start:86 stop:892 length:807 start_codon:yes stop_codon:yes gene_type:complete
MVSRAIDKSKELGKEGFSRTKSFFQGGSVISKLLMTVIFIILFIVCVNLIKRLYRKYQQIKNASPWVFKGTKDAKTRMVILQDPTKYGAITLPRSENEYAGLEFAYMLWIHIDDWSKNENKMKHILHKGNSSGEPLQSPGIWLDKTKNTLVINMNTFENVRETIEVDNIPLNKWVHVTVAARQRNLDVFINGNLIKRLKLKSLPKQNYGDIYLNAFGGFGGFLSNVRYFNHYISFREIDEHIKDGPSDSPCAGSGQQPPYFVPNWWIS